MKIKFAGTGKKETTGTHWGRNPNGLYISKTSPVDEVTEWYETGTTDDGKPLFSDAKDVVQAKVDSNVLPWS